MLILINYPVAWWSENQKGLVATSAVEAEFISMEKGDKKYKSNYKFGR